MSHRRQLDKILTKINQELDIVFQVQVEDSDYMLFATTKTMKCLGCGQEGACRQGLSGEEGGCWGETERRLLRERSGGSLVPDQGDAFPDIGTVPELHRSTVWVKPRPENPDTTECPQEGLVHGVQFTGTSWEAGLTQCGGSG